MSYAPYGREGDTRQSYHSEATALEPLPSHQFQQSPLGHESASKNKAGDVEEGVSIAPAKPEGSGTVDAVWGEVDSDGPGYRTLTWSVITFFLPGFYG